MRSIGIFGHYGNGNLGDEAIVAATIASIRRALPDALLVGFSVNPDDTERRHGMTAFPIRRTIPVLPDTAGRTAPVGQRSSAHAVTDRLKKVLKRAPRIYALLRWFYRLPGYLRSGAQEGHFMTQSFRRLARFDMLIIAGSGQLMDGFGGPWAFPYTLFKWSILAKLRGVKLVFLSVGAGPINGFLSRLFIKTALRLANFHSYRDEYSRNLLEEIGVRRDNHVAPDLACNLALPAISGNSKSSRRKAVGIVPVPYYDRRYWQKNDPERYQSFMHKLASFSIWLAGRDYDVSLFWTKLYTDELVVREIRAIINGSLDSSMTDRFLDRRIAGLDDVVSAMAECDIFIASRFHGILLPLLMQKPVIGLAYHPKTNDMMDYMGQSDYCLSIDEFSVADLQRLFLRAAANVDSVRSTLSRRAGEVVAQLESQYRQVLEPMNQREG